jgi:hypothetical protein
MTEQPSYLYTCPKCGLKQGSNKNLDDLYSFDMLCPSCQKLEYKRINQENKKIWSFMNKIKLKSPNQDIVIFIKGVT